MLIVKQILFTTIVMLVFSACSQRNMVNWLEKRNPEVLFSVETEERVVALTIDDGPHAVVTPLILDVLEKYDAHATFFVVGKRVPGNEHLLERMIDEGHEIGNHMMTGKPSIWLSEDDFKQQLMQNHQLLSDFADPVWMRPAFGFFNDRMLKQLEEAGYRCALGSVYPFDPQIPFVGYLSNYVLRHSFPGDVIILHDGKPGRARTAKVLERVLSVFAEWGYRVVTLSELAEKQ